ncbi:unnamed protein product [Choristocarpus tenellus]
MDRLAYEKCYMHELWVKRHYEERKAEVAQLLQKVSSGDQQAGPVRQLRANISTIVEMKPLQRIRAIIEKDSTLRAYLTIWDGKYQDVLNRVNLHQVHSGRGCDGGGAEVESNNGSVSDDREKEDEGVDEHKGGDEDETGRIRAKGVLSAVFLVRKKNKTKREGGTRAFAVLNAILHPRLGIHAQGAQSRIWANVPMRRL